ncbi:MAG: hypothetical protein AB7I38_18020 [Dehalococcoidia bacterium]
MSRLFRGREAKILGDLDALIDDADEGRVRMTVAEWDRCQREYQRVSDRLGIDWSKHSNSNFPDEDD